MANSEAAAEYNFVSLDKRIAEKHGPSAAFIHHQIGRFCAYNKAEGIDAVKIGGAYWMYMSHERIKTALPWLSISTIRRSIKILIQAGLLESRLRRGTKTERLSSPAALMYRALKYVGAGVFKMNNRGVQNEHIDLVKLDPEKKEQKRRVCANASKGETRTKTTTTTREHTPRSTRSADGPVIFAQVIAEALKNTQPQPRKPKPLPEAKIKEIEAAQAAQAAEDEERLIPELRNLVAILLGSRDIPQRMRETIEAAIQGEFKTTYMLRRWIKQLQAMQAKPNPQPQPETEPAAEAAG